MTKREKLLERLLEKPKDFTWSEATSIFIGFGYRESNKGKTSGSRVKFIHDEYGPINLHKPHPSPILKRYQLEDIIKHLKTEGLI